MHGVCYIVVMSNTCKMEINDFGELNALNKLLGKVKFEHNIDFNEFREFAGSPIIASILERLNEQYISECKVRGHVAEDFSSKFIFDSRTGTTIKMRIDELTSNERETLEQNNSVDSYLQTLLVPLSCDPNEFEQLRKYYLEANKS